MDFQCKLLVSCLTSVVAKGSWMFLHTFLYFRNPSRGPESFQQCGRVGRTSGDRFPPLWATSDDGLLFGSPLRFGGCIFAIWVLWRASWQTAAIREDHYMVGLCKFLSGWVPNISSLIAYFLYMLGTWGDLTFALVPCSLTGLPQLMYVPNVLRCFGLLLIGVRNRSIVWTTGLEVSSQLPWLSSWTCSSCCAPPTEIAKSRMSLTPRLTTADWLVPTSAAQQEGLMWSAQLASGTRALFEPGLCPRTAWASQGTLNFCVLFLLCCNLFAGTCLATELQRFDFQAAFRAQSPAASNQHDNDCPRNVSSIHGRQQRANSFCCPWGVYKASCLVSRNCRHEPPCCAALLTPCAYHIEVVRDILQESCTSWY